MSTWWSIHVEAWNKTYCKTNFVHQVGLITEIKNKKLCFFHDTYSGNHHIYTQYVPTVVLLFHKYHPRVLSHFPSTVTVPAHITLWRTEQFCSCQLLNDHRLYTAVTQHTKSYICSLDMYCILYCFGTLCWRSVETEKCSCSWQRQHCDWLNIRTFFIESSKTQRVNCVK